MYMYNCSNICICNYVSGIVCKRKTGRRLGRCVLCGGREEVSASTVPDGIKCTCICTLRMKYTVLQMYIYPIYYTLLHNSAMLSHTCTCTNVKEIHMYMYNTCTCI